MTVGTVGRAAVGGPATIGSWAGDRFGIGLVDVDTPFDVGLSDLVQVGLRHNPRRAQLLVSTVLGKHLAVDPVVVAGFGRLLGAVVARRLAGQAGQPPARWSAAAQAAVRTDKPGALLDVLAGAEPWLPADVDADHRGVLVIGFAETATALGHLVADQLPGAVYLHSTRRRVPGVPVSAEFQELHSHATGHLLVPRPASLLTGTGPLVLVDDELSTGRTALNVIAELHAIHQRSRYVLAGLVDVRSPADDRTRAEVAERLGCRIDVVALARGRIELAAGLLGRVAREFGTGTAPPSEPPSEPPVEPLTDRPHAEVRRIDLLWPATVPTGGRHGFLPADRPGFQRAVTAAAAVLAGACGAAERVLVIGSEELMYLPLRIALDLASSASGRHSRRQVAFQSTTRSPVHAVDRPTYPVRRRIDFVSDDGGEVVIRHVYNAGWPGSTSGSSPVPADVIVVIDEGDARSGPDGVAAAMAAATGSDVVLAVLPSTRQPADRRRAET